MKNPRRTPSIYQSRYLYQNASFMCVGKINAFKSSSALEKHLAFCSEVPGKKKSQLGRQAWQVSVGLPKRVSDASPCIQQKRPRYQSEDSRESVNEDDDSHGEGPSQPQDYDMIPDEVDISSVSTKQIFDTVPL
jgi:hypothetical protein